jgi:ABC-type transport system involved in cytochrome bd biosynthesis fused ATPase/permease subunit
MRNAKGAAMEGLIDRFVSEAGLLALALLAGNVIQWRAREADRKRAEDKQDRLEKEFREHIAKSDRVSPKE